MKPFETLQRNTPERTVYEQRLREIDEEENRVSREIAELKRMLALQELGVDANTGEINVPKLIKANVSPQETEQIRKEFPKTPLVEAVTKGTLEDLSDKHPKTAKERAALSTYRQATGRVKRVLLNLLVVASCAITGSFSFEKSAESLTYKDINIKDLKDWEKIKLGQDEINKLDNVSIITEANKNSDEKYIILDKSAGLAHLYQGNSLISSYEVGTGQSIGDDQTKTVVKNGKVYWDLGNKQTGAGIYILNNKGTFQGSPSFTMLNERKIEVPTVFHRTLPARNRFFRNNKTEDNRMSNGCINFQADSWNNLSRQKGFGKGTKVYILPDDPHNKYQIVDGELRFLSNDEAVNRTIRPFEPKPIVLIAEDENRSGREFLQTIQNSKAKLMGLYPTVSNTVYNQLAKIAYGVFGQESSFGTYGGARGQAGMIGDYVGIKMDKNVSAGVTQIRITSVNPQVQEAFGIKKTEDLLATQNAAVATMSLLLDIYTTNIPNDKKGDYQTLVPFYYNNPKGSRKAIRIDKKVGSAYVKKVLEYSERVTVYNLAF